MFELWQIKFIHSFILWFSHSYGCISFVLHDVSGIVWAVSQLEKKTPENVMCLTFLVPLTFLVKFRVSQSSHSGLHFGYLLWCSPGDMRGLWCVLALCLCGWTEACVSCCSTVRTCAHTAAQTRTGGRRLWPSPTTSHSDWPVCPPPKHTPLLNQVLTFTANNSGVFKYCYRCLCEGFHINKTSCPCLGQFCQRVSV